MREHLLGRAAEHCTSQACAAVSAHDNQVDRLLAHKFDNFIGWLTFAHDGFDLDACFSKLRADSLQIAFCRASNGRIPGRRASSTTRNSVTAGVCRQRQCAREWYRRVGLLSAVQWDKNLRKHAPLSPVRPWSASEVADRVASGECHVTFTRRASRSRRKSVA